MAGSYGHVVYTEDDDENPAFLPRPYGSLLTPVEVLSMLEASGCGDVFECIEELYGMIWYLAIGADDPMALVKEARERYQEGLAFSPTERYTDS